LLKLNTYDAVIVKVNRIYVGDVLFSPYELDISEVLKPGENEIKLVMRTKLMNIFGDGEPTGIVDANIFYA
jgi:predicted DNA-binding helix-hairpin-helix protein